MTQPTKSRRQKLEEFLAAHPKDAFAQYGLAIELAKEDNHAATIGQFQALLFTHPDYVTGYFQFGQFLARIGSTAEARRVLTDGIAVASRTGDAHARDEISAALAALPAA
jgi:predicted Zn-dependent protease